jgi:hypothetical protein
MNDTGRLLSLNHRVRWSVADSVYYAEADYVGVLGRQVDALVLEVGVGGRYDATNVLPGALACVVNSLDLDHTELLGNTIDQVAWEKVRGFRSGMACKTFERVLLKGG